jgi:hypothetical protein
MKAKRDELYVLEERLASLASMLKNPQLVNDNPENIEEQPLNSANDEETDVTIIPQMVQSLMDKQNSNLTLQENEEETQDSYEEEVRENALRLEEQEQELNYLRQHLEVLRAMKSELESKSLTTPKTDGIQAASNTPVTPLAEKTLLTSAVIEKNYPEYASSSSQDLQFENLMKRLLDASVQDEARTPKTPENQEKMAVADKFAEESSARLHESILVCNYI